MEKNKSPMILYAIIITGLDGEEIWTTSKSMVKISKEMCLMKRHGYDEVYAPVRIATFVEE